MSPLRTQARDFAARLREIRDRHDLRWYHGDTLASVMRLEELLGDCSLDDLVDGRPVLDIGGGDGDLAFFMESLGCDVHLIDHASTNFNQLEGAQVLKRELGSSVAIHDVDLDAQFRLPDGDSYGLVFLLGILYHLKNPYYTLEALSQAARHLFLSTRIARFARDGTRLDHLPVAYLQAAGEYNDDPTNYWIFSPFGLRRVVRRTSWHIMAESCHGDRESAPARGKDERMFMLLRSLRYADT